MTAPKPSGGITPPQQDGQAGPPAPPQAILAPDQPPVTANIANPPPEPPRLPHGLPPWQLAVALAIAAVSDTVSAFVSLVPPVEWAVDFATAMLLFVVLGWRWLLLPGLILEAIPGVSAFPFWVLVVAAVAIGGSARPKLN